MVLIFLVAGCASPDKANIGLRKENQSLHEKIDDLERARAGELATIESLQQSKGTLQTLPEDRLAKLFTVHGVRIERLSGGAKIHPDASTDDAVKIYVTPTDESDQPIKAAGSFVVSIFDLKQSDSQSLGTWEFPTDEARKNWFGQALLYEYVLTCPLTTTPAHDELTIRVAFTDELTQRKFEAQKIVRVNIASMTAQPLTVP